MAKIERVEVLMVDLEPKVKRTDAIQAFVSQETPIVRIFADDGAVGTGYSYTIGTGGHAVVELIARNLAPQLIGRDPERIEEIWKALFFHTHATAVGAITVAGARRHRHGALGHALPPLGPAAPRRGGRRAGRRCRSTPPRAAGCTSRPPALVEDALARQGRRLRRLQGQGRPATRRRTWRGSPRCARRSATTSRSWSTATRAPHVDEAIRRARLYEPLDLAWYEEPLPAEDLGGHVRLSAATTLPIAVGESIYSLPHFREYLQRDACSVVQVDVARIGGITPWLKTAHLAEAFNIAVCPHFLMELHVALTAAVPNGRWIEYIPQLDSLTTDGDAHRGRPRGAVRRARPRHRLGLGRRSTASGSRAQPTLSADRPPLYATGTSQAGWRGAPRSKATSARRLSRSREMEATASTSPLRW